MRVADVREESKETVRCSFNDLWRLNQDRGRGAPSKEYLKRVRARSGGTPQQERDTPPPPRILVILCLVDLRNKLL